MFSFVNQHFLGTPVPILAMAVAGGSSKGGTCLFHHVLLGSNLRRNYYLEQQNCNFPIARGFAIAKLLLRYCH